MSEFHDSERTHSLPVTRRSILKSIGVGLASLAGPVSTAFAAPSPVASTAARPKLSGEEIARRVGQVYGAGVRREFHRDPTTEDLIQMLRMHPRQETIYNYNEPTVDRPAFQRHVSEYNGKLYVCIPHGSTPEEHEHSIARAFLCRFYGGDPAPYVPAFLAAWHGKGGA